MGVINITPDSFSDGKEDLQVSSVKEHILKLQSTCSILDFGAESTAPFNAPISLEEEKKRFEQLFFPNFEFIHPASIISLDTYKPDCFSYLYKKIRELRPTQEIWWNDISGKPSLQTIDLLKADENLKYVYCHNLCPSVEQASHHMEYCLDKDDITEDVIEFFELLPFREVTNQLIVDLCFGFSKTRTQNHNLLKNLDKSLQAFKQYSFLIGISRKSFIRFPADLGLDQPGAIERTEQVQLAIISNVLTRFSGNSLIFRMHRPEQLQLLNDALSYMA